MDNVGVQYGLAALKSGSITPAQFVDINSAAGGVDIDQARQVLAGLRREVVGHVQEEFLTDHPGSGRRRSGCWRVRWNRGLSRVALWRGWVLILDRHDVQQVGQVFEPVLAPVSDNRFCDVGGNPPDGSKGCFIR